MTNRRATALTLVVLAVAALFAGATPADAATTAAPAAGSPRAVPALTDLGAYFIVNQASRRCLDADTTMGGVNGNKVQIWDCNLLNQQQWEIYHYADNRYIIRNNKYLKCLDQDLNHIYQNGARVQLWDCNSQSQQMWWLSNFDPTPTSPPTWRPYWSFLANSLLDADNSTGLGNGSKVQLWQDLGGTNQRWAIMNVG